MNPTIAGRTGRPTIAGCLWLLVVVLVSACSATGAQPQPPTPTPRPPQPALEKPRYTVARVDMVDEITMTGRVSAVRSDDLFFRQAGNAAAVSARTGLEVSKGQLLAELEQGDRQKQLEQARLALQQAKLSLEHGQEAQRFAISRAELDLEEARTVLRLANTPDERELAQFGVRRAEINLQEAQAATDEELEQRVAQAQLDYNRVYAQVEAGKLRAPYDGVVTNVTVGPGAPVQPYQPVITIIDPTDRDVQVGSVVESDLSRLSLNQPVMLSFARYPGLVVPGVIKQLPTETGMVDPSARVDTSVHISYQGAGLDLDIGDLATAKVTLQRKDDTVALPPQAIRELQGRQFVVVQEGERQRRVDVELGIRNDDRVEIVSGLKEGQVVVGQ